MSGRQLINLLNLVTGLVVVALLLKISHLVDWFYFISPVYIVIALLGLHFAKSWVQDSYKVVDPVRANRLTNGLYYMGSGVIILAILFKIMHWPFQSLLLIIGVSLMVAAYILAPFLPATEKERNDDILDDINS